MEKLLNKLLASTAIYYQNVKSFHWLIKGKHFFDLHAKFGELYECADDDIDMIAERILAIDSIPLHTYEDFINTSMVDVSKNVSRDVGAIKDTIKGLNRLVIIEEEIIDEATSKNDQATMDLAIKMLGVHQKNLWMLNAWAS